MLKNYSTNKKVSNSMFNVFKTIAVVVFFFTATSKVTAQGGGGLDTFYVVQQVPTSPVPTGSAFVDVVNYTWGNTTTAGINAVATITLPPNVVPSSGTISTDFNTQQVSSVTYDGINTITITFKNPLPAGSTGALSLGLMFTNGTTPNGYAPNIVSSLTATNKLSSDDNANPGINTVSVTASATNGLSVTKYRLAGGAINDSTIYQINVNQTGGNGYLNLKNPTLIDTLPAHATFYSATAFNGSYAPIYANTGGVQTITWTWGTVGVDTSFSGYSSTAYVTVSYDAPNSLNDNVCNTASINGTVAGLPIGTDSSVYASGKYCESLAASSDSVACNGGGITAADFSWFTNSYVYSGTSGNTFSNGWKNLGNTSLSEVDLTDTIDNNVFVSAINIKPLKDALDSVTAATINVTYKTNLGTYGPFTYNSTSIPNGTTLTPSFSLTTPEYITQISYQVTGVLPLGCSIDLSYSGTIDSTTGNDGSDVIVAGTYGDNDTITAPNTAPPTMIYNKSGGSYTYNGTTKNFISCNGSAEIIYGQPAFHGTAKSITNGSNFAASDTVNYQLTTYLGGDTTAKDVTFTDTLDNRLTYIPSSSTFVIDNGAATTITPSITTATDGTSRTILTYTMANPLTEGHHYYVNFKAEIKPGTAAGTISNQFKVNSSNALFSTVSNPVDLIVLSAVAMRAYKGQSGCESGYVYYPTVASAQSGGHVNYQITVMNLGNVAADSLVLVDVFPFLSDYRGSQWYASLASPIKLSGASVYYTSVANPCYTDFTPATKPSGCTTPSWSTTPPVDLTTVTAVKIVKLADINPMDTIMFSWPMVAPVGVPSSLLMTNSFTYQVRRKDLGTQLLPSTPLEVQMNTDCTPTGGSIGNYVWIDSNRNGQLDEDSTLGLNGVKVYLYSTPDGTYGSGVVIDSTITANDWTGKPGLYLFTNVNTGDYFVKFPTSFNGDSLTKVVDQTIKTDNNSDANVTTGYSEIVHIDASLSASGQDKNNTTIDAGYVPYGSIGNYVWYDADGDGRQNDGSGNGINGIKVYLYELTDTGFARVDSTVTATVNSKPGYYNFIIDSSGQYKVLFPTKIETKILTTANQSSNSDGNSDADVTTGFSEVAVMKDFVTRGYHKDNPTIDAGYKCNVQKPVLTAGSLSLCTGFGTTLTATDTTYSPAYQWYKNGSLVAVGTANTLATTLSGSVPSPAGAYIVTTTDTGGCISPNSDTITIAAPQATKDTLSVNACTNYTWHGTTYTTSGAYNFDSLNAAGCDSLTTLVLTIGTIPSSIGVTITAATCNSLDNPKYDGKISLAAANNATKFGISSLNAASYNGASFSGATTIGTLPTYAKTGVPNTGGTYILRAYNSDSICYTDVTVTVAEVLCGNSCTNTVFPVGSAIPKLDWVTPPDNAFTMYNFYTPGSSTPFIVNKTGPTASSPPTPFTIYAPGNLSLPSLHDTNYTAFCADLSRVLYINSNYTDYKVEPLEYLDKEDCGVAGTPGEQIPDGGIGPVRAGMIRYLVDQHFVSTNSTNAAWTTNNYGIAFQIALWEITNDQYKASPIDFTVRDSTGNGLYFDTNANNSSAAISILDSAEAWVKDIQSKVWDWTTYVPTKWHTVALNTNSAQDLITVEPISVCSVSGVVSSGGSGGLESKSLGAAIGDRNFNMYKNGKNGPVQYTQNELIQMPKKGSFGTFGIGTTTSLASLMPYKVSDNYLPYDKTADVSDLKAITNAIDVRAIDFTQSNLPKAAVFATQTIGGIYDHTKPICDRLKGGQLLDIENVQVQGINFIQYKIQQPNGDLEYAVSFSAGIKGGRDNYSIQSDWLMPDYTSEDTMLNYQLWAATPDDVTTMVTEVLSKLSANMPVAQLYNANDLPSAYVSAANRLGTNLNLTINNRTANTSGYFTLTQRSNENASVSDNVVVPFTINANGSTTVSIPVGDTYDANISMVFNNATTDMLYMADGIWGTSTDKSTTVSQFNVINNSSRTYPDNEFALLRDVQVQVTTPSYLSIYKYLKGGASAVDLSAYKSFHFNTATNAEGMNLQVTITKQSVANWNSQYTYTINNYQDGQTYNLALSDFKSADGTLPATIDASDITSVVYNVINPTGQSISITTGITNAAFSTEDIAYERSLQVKAIGVSPNPNNGNFKVSFASPSAAQLTLKVVDVAGRLISSTPVSAIIGKNEVSINLSRVVNSNNVYFITLVGEGVKYNTQEVIMKK